MKRNLKKAILALLLSGVMVLLAAPVMADEASDEPIKLGLLEDRSGDFASIGIMKHSAAVLAVEEINEAGGLLGRQIELIDPDPQSDTEKYQQLVRQLILDDEVDVIMGGVASSAREAIRPLMDEYKQLYFYNQHYEGGVADHYTFCCGVVPEMQITYLMKMMKDNGAKSYYFLGPDYNAGYGNAAWAKYLAELMGMECLGEEYIPLEETQYASSIERIRQLNPDFVFCILTGANQSSFWGQWRQSGIEGMPFCSPTLCVQSYEHKLYDPPALEGLYVNCNYCEEVDTPDAKAFTEKMYARFPDLEYIGLDAANEYEGVMLWAEAVRRAGTTEDEAVIAELEKGIQLEHMPSGTITMNGDSHAVTKDMANLLVDENHDMQTISTVSQSKPYFLSDIMGIDLRETPELSAQYSVFDAPEDAVWPSFE